MNLTNPTSALMPAKFLRPMPISYSKIGNSKVVIEGHCDERGTAEYNMALGQRRAQETKKYLVNLGIKESRIKTISYGEERPLDPGHNEDAWAKNRRAHFVVTP